MEKGKSTSLHDLQMFSLQDKENGIRAEICSIGASLMALEIPLADGSRRDVILGYEAPETYYENEPHLGATVAPFANRIGGASFSLNGETYSLKKNDGENCLHGGFHFLQDYSWKVKDVSGNRVTFSADCEDGENGFPGPLHVDVTYSVTDRALLIDYHGSALHAEKDVLFNPTNHSYFNLNGQKSKSMTDAYSDDCASGDYGTGNVLTHGLTIFSGQITPAGPDGVPDGRVINVAGTPFDFLPLAGSADRGVGERGSADEMLRTERLIGERIDEDDPILRKTGGYDQNYILCKEKTLRRPEYDANGHEIHLAARLTDASGKVTMEVLTDQPGLQLYTANFLSVKGTGKGGKDYGPRSAVCLETQYYPNAVNIPSFPQPVIRAGEEMYSRTVYRF